ncbi:MAG: hypothetical protein AAGN82_23490 [Myxococcota bacterium]
MKRPEEPPGEAPSETSPAPSAGRRAQWRRGAAGLFAFLGLVGAGACQTGDPRGQPGPLGGGDTPGTTGVGGGADGGEACAEPGARRDCKVDINAQNCLEGAQVCENGRWGSCLPDAPLEGARGEWQAASLGPPAPCTGNPCNPVCQAFDEDPAPDLEATGTPPPPNAAGTIDDAPAAIKNACIDDTTTTCGNNCTSTGYCQFDTRCLTPPGSTCVPWQDGQFDTGAGDPDFTIKVGCDSSVVTVCNRGDAPGGNGVGISVWTPNPALCGGSSGCQGALKTGLAAAAGESARGTCTIPSNIAPGDCAAVPCDLSGHPASLVHVNGCDEFACVSESDQDNNWGYYDNSVGCTCAAATAGSALRPVTMYLMLDSSGSMVSLGLWNPARNAVNDFVQDPGSDTINYAFRVYGNSTPNACTQGDCSAAACGSPILGPDLLSNGAHESALVSFLNGATTGGNGTPHRPAIEGMADWGRAWRTGHPDDIIALVYITDGDEGDCYFSGANQNLAGAQLISTPAGQAFANDGVLFFGIALPNANLLLMNELAAQGGTGSAIDLTSSTNITADVTQALQDIQGNLLSCEVAIPNAGTVDPAQVTVTYDPTSGADRPLTQVASAAACSGGDQFYFLPNATNPTDAVMCPVVCDAVRADVGSTVEFTGGCAGGYTAEQFVYEYDGDCTGYPEGSSAFWDFLRYDTTIPGDATVTFEVSTSNVSTADAATGPWQLVATADIANPDALPASPVDLRNALGVTAAQAPFAALRVTVNPTSSGANTPSVDDWDLQYSCEFNQ